MFPILNKKQLGNKWKRKAQQNRTNAKKSWRDEEPPASIELIYNAIQNG